MSVGIGFRCDPLIILGVTHWLWPIRLMSCICLPTSFNLSTQSKANDMHLPSCISMSSFLKLNSIIHIVAVFSSKLTNFEKGRTACYVLAIKLGWNGPNDLILGLSHNGPPALRHPLDEQCKPKAKWMRKKSRAPLVRFDVMECQFQVPIMGTCIDRDIPIT